MVDVRGLASRLLDAFVDGIEPVFGRLLPHRRLMAVEEPEGLAFYAAEGGAPVLLARGEATDERAQKAIRRAATGAIELRVSPERVITKTLQLPSAGRDYLEPIVEHRLERLTPWRPEKVLYGFAVSGEPAADGSMAVDFAATSADVAASRIAALDALGLTPTAVGSAAEPLDRPLRIDFYRGKRDVVRRRLRRAAAFALIVVAAVLVPATVGTYALSYMADQELADVEARLALKRSVVARATGTGAAESRDLRLIQAKKPETSMMVMIDRLARLLPDDTYLREMEIDGEKIRLVGQSSNAPALIAVLEEDEALSGVRFGAPVTRDDAGRDGFDISATWDARAPATTESTAALTVQGDLP